MDTTQLTIILISVALAVLIIVLGVQVWFILKEVRNSFHKMNKMLDDVGKVSGAVSEGIVGMTGFMTGLKTGISAITSLLHRGDNHE
jgi:predicted AlkP superfamily phosphohydrolase/phosphomutase